MPVQEGGLTLHSYVFRARGGETRKIAQLAAEKLTNVPGTTVDTNTKGAQGQSSLNAGTTPVILGGPYGQSMVKSLTSDTNVLCVAGGTGIAYVLPVVLSIARETFSTRAVQLVWVIRRFEDRLWIEKELATIALTSEIRVRIFVTREADKTSPTLPPTRGATVREDHNESEHRATALIESAKEATDQPKQRPMSTERRQEKKALGIVEAMKSAAARSPEVVYMGELETRKGGDSKSETIPHHRPAMSLILDNFFSKALCLVQRLCIQVDREA